MEAKSSHRVDRSVWSMNDCCNKDDRPCCFQLALRMPSSHTFRIGVLIPAIRLVEISATDLFRMCTKAYLHVSQLPNPPPLSVSPLRSIPSLTRAQGLLRSPQCMLACAAVMVLKVSALGVPRPDDDTRSRPSYNGVR